MAIRVVVYDSQVDALWNTRGPVGIYTRRLADSARKHSRREAPKRSGRMAAQIVSTNRRVSKRHRVGEVVSQAPYSIYVHEGTSYTSAGRRSDVPGGGSQGRWRPGMRSTWPRVSRRHTAGIEPNNFLVRGMNMAVAEGVAPIRVRRGPGGRFMRG